MKTLYDLLAVSPDADVKALKIAFRKAVKANHPDLHREDPHVPSKFRQIVAANTILSDAVQRAAYDQLLKLERQRCRLQWRRLIISAAIVFTVALVWARWINTLSSQTILTAINSKRGAARTEIGVGDVGSQTVGNSLYEGRNGSAEVPEMVRQITSTAAPDNAGLASDLETMVAIAGTNYDRPQPIVDARTVINLPLPPVGPVPAMKPQTVPTPIAPAVTQGLASLPPLITPSGAQNSLDTAKSQPRRLAPTEIALMVKNGTDYMANGNIGAAA